MLVEQFLYVRGIQVVESGELNGFVSLLGDLAERSIEILHGSFAQGIELDPDLVLLHEYASFQ
jgi:hypothetical protein